MTERSDLHFLMCMITFDITSGHPRRSWVKEHIDFSLYPTDRTCVGSIRRQRTQSAVLPFQREMKKIINNKMFYWVWAKIQGCAKYSAPFDKGLQACSSLSREHLEKAVVKDSRVLLHFKYGSPGQRVGLMLTLSSTAKEGPEGCYRM